MTSDRECRCGASFTPRNCVHIYCSQRCKGSAKFSRRKAEWKAKGDLEKELAERKLGQGNLAPCNYCGGTIIKYRGEPSQCYDCKIEQGAAL